MDEIDFQNMTEEERDKFLQHLSALIIQKYWKKYRYYTAICQVVPSRRRPVMVFYSSIPSIQRILSNNDKLFMMLFKHRVPYYKLDLVDNKWAQSLVKDLLILKFETPYVLINNIYIGGYDEFEDIVEAELLDVFLDKQNVENLREYDKRNQLQDQQYVQVQE